MCIKGQQDLFRSSKERGYKCRINSLKFTTLETRRKRCDLIRFYKILNKKDRVKWKKQISGKNLRLEVREKVSTENWAK